MGVNKHFFAAFAAFFIWGFFGLALKPLTDYPSLDILFYRIFLSVAIMGLINTIFRRKKLKENWINFNLLTPNQKKKSIILTLSGSVLIALNWFVFIYVVNHVSLKAASLAYMICPILTTVLAFFILKEKLSNWQWFAVFVSSIGCGLLSINHVEDIFFSFITAATYALYLISQRNNNHIDKFLSLSIQLAIIAIIILPFYPNFSGVIPVSSLFYFYILIIVLFFTIVPLFLNLYALKGINSSTVGILMYINPIINFSIAVLIYHESVTLLQMISYFLIFLAVIIFNEKLIFKKSN
jgi:chloramphenicol-sensitive protein RarD